jgi:ribonuclease Z
MELTMLGTGNAMVTECYNTCFMVHDHHQYFMVDGGGGNTILRQLNHANFHLNDIKEIFVTHKHIDHLMGIIWVVRAICQLMRDGRYEGDVHIYSHDEVAPLIKTLSKQLLLKNQYQFVDDRIHLITVHDGEERIINGRKTTFFDIQSIKEKQFGFCMELDHGEKLTCCGDEPYHSCEEAYAQNSKWLLHEAFCLHSQADIFKPYDKQHSTVKDACEFAEKLGVQNLILYHTEDKNIQQRENLYSEEGRHYFHGNLYIPNDLDRIPL